MSKERFKRFVSEDEVKSFSCGSEYMKTHHNNYYDRNGDYTGEYIGICDLCTRYTCNSQNFLSDRCGSYCDMCDKLICGQCLKSDPRNHIFTSSDPNFVFGEGMIDHCYGVCIDCLNKHTDVASEDGININNEYYFETISLDNINTYTKLNYSYINKKEAEIAELKQENEQLKLELKYRPGGEGAREAQNHFENLSF